MSLENRIKNISVACNPSGESMRHKAATLAADADELMWEMAKTLCGIDPDQLTLDQQDNLTRSLVKYNNWKEKTNDQ